MGGECSTYGEMRGAYRVLVGKPEGNIPLGRIRVDVRIILKCITKGDMMGVDWIGLAYLRLVLRLRMAGAVPTFALHAVVACTGTTLP